MNSAELNILAIDTATDACSVALNLGGAITRRYEVARNGHSKLVLGMAESLLQRAGVALGELDALAVDIGPGSFTGLRIGIGVAQGLGYGAGLKVIPVISLEALACGVGDETAHETVLPAIDARMGQVYYGLYAAPPKHLKLQAPRVIIPPALAAPEALTIGGEKEIIGVGNAWDRYAPTMLKALNGSASKWLTGRYPEAAAVSQIAAARGMSNAVSPLHLSAAYIRDKVAETPRP